MKEEQRSPAPVECSQTFTTGCEYLLLLAQPQVPQSEPLTPYWAALAATNEQVFGQDDPWVEWVRHELARAGIKNGERRRDRPGRAQDIALTVVYTDQAKPAAR